MTIRTAMAWAITRKRISRFDHSFDTVPPSDMTNRPASRITSTTPSAMATKTFPIALPAAGVGHGDPRLGRRQRAAFLQQLDGYSIRRAHECHVAIARGAIDDDARIHQPFAGGINVVHAIGQVAEIAAALIVFLVPIVSELHQRRLVLGGALGIGRGGEEHQVKASLVALPPARLGEHQLAAIEIERQGTLYPGVPRRA